MFYFLHFAEAENEIRGCEPLCLVGGKGGILARSDCTAHHAGRCHPPWSCYIFTGFGQVFRTGGIASSSNNLPTGLFSFISGFVLFLFLFSGSHSLPQRLIYWCWAFWRLKYKVTCKNEPTPSKQAVLFRVDLKEAALCFEISDKGLATT